MRKGIIYIMLALCLCGCGSRQGSDNFGYEKAQSIVTLEELQAAANVTAQGNQEQQKVGEMQQNETQEQNRLQDINGVREQHEVPINSTEEITTMKWDSIRIQSRIAANVGNKLYFCQWAREGRTASLYECEVGGDTLQKVDMELPEGMDIYDMSNDEKGYLYLLMRDMQGNSSKVTSIVRVLDYEGKLVQDIDISQAMEDNISLHRAFLVDGEGNFYIRGMSSAVYVNGKGELLWETMDREIGIQHAFGEACNEEGDIYLSYRKADCAYIGRINTADSSIAEEYLLKEMEAQDKVLAMGKGTDCDFLLYGNASGCWAWKQSDNTMELRRELSESELPYEECIIIRKFLEDGRLLLVKNISQEDALTGRKLEYYPARR